MIERYVLDEIIGKGFYSYIYKAYDKILNKNVAIKFIDIENAMNEDGLTKNEIFEEATILAKLSGFPKCNEYVVCYYDAHELIVSTDGVEKSVITIITELIDGITLRELISKYQINFPILPDQLWILIYKLINGLSYIHSFGLIHGDVNGDNIIIEKYNNVKYIDFGLSYKKTYKDNENFKTNKAFDIYRLGTWLYALSNNQSKLLHSPPSNYNGSQFYNKKYIFGDNYINKIIDMMTGNFEDLGNFPTIEYLHDYINKIININFGSNLPKICFY